MAVINDDGPVADRWRQISDGEAIGGTDAIIVSLAIWRQNRSALAAGRRPLGLHLPNDARPAELAAAVESFALIELTFPKFSDGRAYSQARTLREKLGFAGEIRAAGDFGRDQLAFLVKKRGSWNPSRASPANPGSSRRILPVSGFTVSRQR